MEKLKNENLKKIEIKIEGDNCIISYPSSKINSINEAPTFPQLDNELKGTVDLNLSLSSNSEDFISNLKEIKKNNKDYYDSNSKKKLEITNKSIFYSESNIKSTTERNKKLSKKNNEDRNKETLMKNSIIKKLNFDLCEAKKDLDINKKLSESDRTKNKNIYLYKNKNTLYNLNYNIANIFMNPKNKIDPTQKRINSMINYEIKTNKDENSKKLNHNNKRFIRHKQNNSFVASNPFNIKNSSLNNSHIQIIDKKPNIVINVENTYVNNKKMKNKKRKYKSPKIFNKKRNIKNNLDKMTEDKSLVKSNFIRFKSSGNFSSSKKGNKAKIINNKEKENKNNKSKNNKNINIIKKINIIRNERTLNKNISNYRKSFNISNSNSNSNSNKKNMFCIKKPNKKIIPYLTSAIINNANSKINKLTNINKNNEYCSLKQYYHLKTPSLLNAQGPSSTPITSTNGCTNCTNCSTLNSTSTNTTKIFFKPNKEDKKSLIKYFSQHSILKNIVHNSYMNNNNNNLNENKNINKNQKKRYKSKNMIDINEKENTNKNRNICRNNNRDKDNNKDNNKDKSNNLNHRTTASGKALQSSKSKNKNMDYNNKILNKCKTNELQNILKSNVKYLHKILTERNINPGSFNSSVNNNGSKIYENDSGNNNDIKDVNKILMKNKLNKIKEQNKENKIRFVE